MRARPVRMLVLPPAMTRPAKGQPGSPPAALRRGIECAGIHIQQVASPAVQNRWLHGPAPVPHLKLKLTVAHRHDHLDGMPRLGVIGMNHAIIGGFHDTHFNLPALDAGCAEGIAKDAHQGPG